MGRGAATEGGCAGRRPGYNVGMMDRRIVPAILSNDEEGLASLLRLAATFAPYVQIDFMERMLRQLPGKVFLILDRHPVHRSRSVTQWAAEQKDRIRLFFLPAYSPELNPDEFLNQDVKSNALGRRRPETRKEMISGLRSYLWSTQRRPAAVKNFFHAESVRYAAAM